ncbi:hypothetical protein GCM10019016_079460 [Streptomyces prasinosporus]|uniref:DUF2933 domain-containing protein n=2 Tax=Streptomyces TaxID=1883 RepID=A0ABP6U2C0_9ACTN|nr:MULTISPECIES: DUF2933 domain-containing protein [Streptomyces]MCG0062723.1 DUF2933 domain-containing protein [Streptomyces tricolor]GHC13893.1 hypothetical protein GCM10010332_49680 [Streptomyces albogriseolus]
MTNDKRPLYALAAAIGIVGLVALGVPIGTIVLLAVLAACPLMMIFMMRGMHGGGMHGGHDHTDESTDRDRDPLRKHDQDGHQHPYGHGRS